jgi:hypothetical protein
MLISGNQSDSFTRTAHNPFGQHRLILGHGHDADQIDPWNIRGRKNTHNTRHFFGFPQIKVYYSGWDLMGPNQGQKEISRFTLIGPE